MISIARKTKSFAIAPLTDKLLFAEALLTSAYVKTTLLFLPFRIVMKWLGSQRIDITGASAGEHEVFVKRVRLAVRRCNGYAPWPTECYTRALTARIMLKRRKLPSTLCIGFCKDDDGKLKGHAWLQSSGVIVTGFCDFSRYTVHSTYN